MRLEIGVGAQGTRKTAVAPTRPCGHKADRPHGPDDSNTTVLQKKLLEAVVEGLSDGAFRDGLSNGLGFERDGDSKVLLAEMTSQQKLLLRVQSAQVGNALANIFTNLRSTTKTQLS